MTSNIQTTRPRAKRHDCDRDEFPNSDFHMPNPVSEAEVQEILDKRAAKEKEGLEE